MKKRLRFLPNLATLANLAAGVSGLYFLFKGEVIYASWMILLGALMDVLDGLLARALDAASPIGKDLDSLADLVSFGLLPAAIMAWFTHQAGGPEILVWLVFLLPPLAAAWRLARFNNDPGQQDRFLGLPAPAAGLFLGSWPLGIAYGYGPALRLMDILTSHTLSLLLISAAIALLMISRLPLLSFKMKSLRDPRTIYLAVLLLSTVLILIFSGMAAIPFIVVLYLLLSFAAYVLGLKSSSNPTFAGRGTPHDENKHRKDSSSDSASR